MMFIFLLGGRGHAGIYLCLVYRSPVSSSLEKGLNLKFPGVLPNTTESGSTFLRTSVN